MPMTSLKDLYVDELKDLYNAERQIVAALPKIARAATSAELRGAFQEHLEQTKEHIQRLDQLFRKLGEKPAGKECMGMKGILKEGEEVLAERTEPAVKDAALIASAQKVEHYEMATYGTARTHAATLGDQEAADTLQLTLDEEKEADAKLISIAEGTSNPEAAENA